MQDDTALYGAKMMQPGMTAADSEENNLRPQHLEDYIGQEKVKQNLKIYLEAAKRRGELHLARVPVGFRIDQRTVQIPDHGLQQHVTHAQPTLY